MKTGTHNPNTGRYLPLCLQNREHPRNGETVMSAEEWQELSESDQSEIKAASRMFSFRIELDDTGEPFFTE